MMSPLCLPTDYPVGRESVSMGRREGKRKYIGRDGTRERGMKEGREEEERKTRGVCLPCLGACYSEEPLCLPSVGWPHLVLS